MKILNMLIVAGYYSYVSVLNERLCVFVPEVMVRGTIFVVICVLLCVINIREVDEPSAFEVQMVI